MQIKYLAKQMLKEMLLSHSLTYDAFSLSISSKNI